MQTLESLGVPASAFLIPHTHNMPEAPNAVPPGWVHPQQQGFPTPMEQQAHHGMNGPQPNHIFVMNSVKPEQQIPRREEVITSPTPSSSSATAAPPSVITATYNPTYNRCLPKILSDLDCEMKIKQVLRCIENILLENGDVDLQQQAYKLPDRSSSPQFAKSTTKKPKFKEDEEMVLSPNNGPAINLPLATNSPASLINKATANKTQNQNPIKINVKVEPEGEKGVRPPPFPEQSLPNGSPRNQMFDFSYKQQPHPSPQQQQGFTPQMGQAPPQRFGFENYPPSPAHPTQPMIPHIQLSMSSPHLSTPGTTNSPHLQHHLHASSPHLHTSHANSPHLQHSPLTHTHSNSPHIIHSPIPHSPLVASQVASPHLPAASPLTQFQVITNPHPPEQHQIHDSIMSDLHYPPLFDGVQAGGQHIQQKKDGHNVQEYVLDPALFAQYLAHNQQQLQQLQQQLQQQQQQHTQLQQHQQRQLQQHLQQPTPSTQASASTPTAPSTQLTTSAQQPTPSTTTTTTTAPHAPLTTQPPPLNAPLHLFDAHHPHPITLSGHMSFSGHLSQIGPDGIPRLGDDEWILSLLNTDSNIAHDLSLSGHIPPL